MSSDHAGWVSTWPISSSLSGHAVPLSILSLHREALQCSYDCCRALEMSFDIFMSCKSSIHSGGVSTRPRFGALSEYSVPLSSVFMRRQDVDHGFLKKIMRSGALVMLEGYLTCQA